MRDLIVAGDNIPEGPELLYVDVFATQPQSSCSAGGTPVAVVAVTIEDDDADAPRPELSLQPTSELRESDVDYVSVFSVGLDAAADRDYCYPYTIAYGPSTASEADAWLVAGPHDLTPVPHGSLHVSEGASIAVSTNLLVAGDDLAEPIETLQIQLYSPVPVVSDASGCAPFGTPVAFVELTIIDDDAPVSIAELTIENAPANVVFEGDPGDPFTPVVVVVHFGRLTVDPFVLLYGSVPTGSASERDVEFVERRSALVPPGQFSFRVEVATLIPDALPEAAETFLVWVQVDDYPSTRMEIDVTIGNDDIPGDLTLSVRLVGLDDFDIPEGDPEFNFGHSSSGPCSSDWLCVPVELGLAERFPKDARFEVNLLPGTATPHLDYVPLEGVPLILREGHLRTYDLAQPLRLEIRRDFVAESSETFFLVVHQMVAGGAPLLSWFEQLTIVDDDAVTDDGSEWFGTGEDVASCPDESFRVFSVREPAVGVSAQYARLRLVLRTVAQTGTAEAGCVPPASSKPVDYHYDLISESGVRGVDVALVGGEAGNILRFQRGVAELDLVVFADSQLEPPETLRLQLYSGIGAVASYTVTVQDYDTTHEIVSADVAAYARIGRVLATDVSDSLADRFSCAASTPCQATDGPLAVPLYPRPVRAGAEDLWRRLLALARVLGSRPASLPGRSFVAGAASSPSGFRSGVGVSAPGASLASHHVRSSLTAGASPLAEIDRTMLLGNLLGGLRFQGDPGRWIGPRNIAAGPSSTPAWSFWGRGAYADALDAGSSGRRLRSTFMSFTGGLDRRLGSLRVGWLHTYAFGSDDVGFHELTSRYLATPATRESTWHLTGPYVGFVPDPRIRAWVSTPWAWGGSRRLFDVSEFDLPSGLANLPALSRSGPRVGMRLLVVGSSVTVANLGSVAIDAEGDFFDVHVNHGLVDPGSEASLPPAYAQRRRLGFRFAVPLGHPDVTASRFSVRVLRRWDSGTDIDWVWSGLRSPVEWLGSGFVSATDVVADYRRQPRGSRLSLAVSVAYQVQGEVPDYPLEPRYDEPSSSRLRAHAAVGFGAVQSRGGWSATLRPAYGTPSLGMPMWWSAAALSRRGMLAPVPTLDADVGYTFVNQARVAFGARRAFVSASDGPGGVAGDLGAVVRFDRSW